MSIITTLIIKEAIVEVEVFPVVEKEDQVDLKGTFCFFEVL